MGRRITSEMRQKIAIANSSLESCTSFLSDARVVRVGGELAREALSLIDYVYVPNMKDGVYDLTHLDEHDERIPFIIALPGEEVKFARDPSKVVHPHQWEHIATSIDKIDSDEMTEESFQLFKKWVAETCYEVNGDTICLDIPPNAYAFVYSESPAIKLSRKKGAEPKVYFIESRPIMIGNALLLTKPEAGSNLYHEMIHDIQFLSGKNSVFQLGPQRVKAHRSKEVEAYSRQAIAEEAYYGIRAEDNPFDWSSMAVEAIRRKLNAASKDPYRMNKKFMAELQKHDLQIER